jgi:ferric-dicitrate binding protein FerR (iron transport regulator)
MKKEQHQLDELIEKYLANKCTGHERELLDKFADRQRNQLDWNERLMGPKKDAFKAINEGILEHSRTKRRLPAQLKRLSIGVSVAASLILILSIWGWLKSASPRPELYSMQTVAKADSLLLPDGSVIYLSPETQLSYTDEFNREKREINLIRGNAFFKVAHNPQKPFIITSGAIKTKVLGTSFNIHTGRDGYRVTVHTGKVNVSSASENVNITPLQEASYSKADQKLSVSQVNPVDISPWYNRDITLANQNMQTIVRLIEKKYSLETTQS